MNSSYANIGPLRLYYEIHGDSGRPLLLIHGGGSTIGTSFGRIFPLLSVNRRIIAVEMQAHGHTRDIDRPLSFEQDADDLAALLNMLNFPKADVLGFSNGGNTALQLAVRHASLVHKLVVISAFYKREGMMPGFFEFMKGASLANMPQSLQDAYLEIDPSMERLERMHNRDRDRMLAFVDWDEELLGSIQSPTLFIAGDKDVMTAKHTTDMWSHVPNARLAILPGMHGDCIGEVMSANEDQYRITARLIGDFLDAEES